jgi:hypothetical protein
MPFTPEYRFGFGLSYTQFRYSNLQIIPKADDPGFVTVSADVQNVGTRNGDEVVQLYVTDENASVSTPVIELEGISRVALKVHETKKVSFELTPYQLSILDANMVRRVEAGKFRIHVGGVSPDVPSDINEGRKARIGFYNPLEGITGEFSEPKTYSARFTYSMAIPETAANGQPFDTTVTVKNDGNLTDVTEAKIYEGVELDSWRFELKPGEEKAHTFETTIYKSGEIALVAGPQIILKPIAVVPSPARLRFQDLHLHVDDNGTMELNAIAQNVGSYSFAGPLTLRVDSQSADSPQSVKLDSGEKTKITLSHNFTVGGLHRVQLNDLPEQLLMVPGGVSLAFRSPLLFLKLDEGNGEVTKNEITGKSLALQGKAKWVTGRDDAGIEPSSLAGISAGDIQLYRKSFTLSAWIRIDTLDGGELGVFGDVPRWERIKAISARC